MNEPQVWTLIGVFATGMFGMIAVVPSMFTRVLRTEIGGLRAEMTGEIGGLRAEFRGELAELRTDLKGELASLRTEVRTVDRDVSALMKHTFGVDRD
nr:hypothetical protein [Actinomycetota bacterium]